MKSYLIPIFLLFTLGCGKRLMVPGTGTELASSQESCGFVQNSSNQRVSWKQNIPFKIYIDTSVPSEFEGAIISAANEWNKVVGKQIINVIGQSSSHQGIQNGIFYLNSWPSNSTNQQATTSISWSRTSINSANIRLNSQNFDFYLSTPSKFSDVHMESLMIHELGHALGLKHKSDLSSVMYFALSGSTVREKITDQDKTSIKCEY